MDIRSIPAHKTNYADPRTSRIDRIVIHYTGDSGATAENEGRYFAGANRNASAHYFVDAKEIVQSVPDDCRAFHAGNKAMNDRSIGVEMCCFQDARGLWYIPCATLTKTRELVGYLMAKYKIPKSCILRHYDVTGKRCPEPFVREPQQWADFLNGIEPSNRNFVQIACGYDNRTMRYLDGHPYKDALYQKMVDAIMR